MEQCNRSGLAGPNRGRDRRCDSIVVMYSPAVHKALLRASLVVMLAAMLSAATSFQAGEVLSVTAARGLDGVARHRFAIFTIQIGDVIYTGSGKRIKHSSDDFQEGLNAGDAIQAAINGDDLILRKPHGGEFKTKIVKRVRAQ
jgi:hypothetical protein